MAALGAEEPVSLARPSLKIFTSRFAALPRSGGTRPAPNCGCEIGVRLASAVRARFSRTVRGRFYCAGVSAPAVALAHVKTVLIPWRICEPMNWPVGD